MGKIITLDENTINKIAAGEVVERPASVVKELVENSIDAKASKISVEIKKGGITYIKVTDNGVGIAEDDVAIAFERHSTSKIKHSGELSAILSLGFRGEALASIAAVSNIEMITSTKDKAYGLRANVEGGHIQSIGQTGAPIGTSIIVKNLFFNTPARFKFLKKDATEAGYVSDIVSRIALGNPSIAVELINNGITIINTPGNGDLLSTITSIYGIEVGKSVLEISYKDDLLEIKGYVGEPKISRPNRNHQSLFLNGRYIKSKPVTSAIDEAFKTYVMRNKFAFAVLMIKINPSLVDINVHPTKMEVRFSADSDIYRGVYYAIKNSLSNNCKIKEIETDEPFELRKTTLPIEGIQSRIVSEQDGIISNDIEELQYTDSRIDLPVQEFREDVEIYSGIKDARLVGQLFSTYIVLQKDDYILLIDQHAAHERIMFEKIRENYLNNETMSQDLIVPIVINLTYQDLKTLEEHKEFFIKVGFIYEEFGNNSIIIRAVPYGEIGLNGKEYFLELLNIAESYTKRNYSDLIENILYNIACKAAVKANMRLEKDEVVELLKKLLTMENPYTCPHGRPTIVKIPKIEIEKIFKRKL